MLYLDRVEYTGNRCKDRWFQTTRNSTTDVVKIRNKDEMKFPKRHGKRRTINREEYQKIIHEGEIDMQTKSVHMAPENEAHTESLASTYGSPPAPKEPSVACGSEREPLIVGLDGPIEVR